MASESPGGPCGCITDAGVSRVLDQSLARYNDRSGFANNAAQDGFNFLFSTFTASAQNMTEATPSDALNTQMAQVLSLANLLKT